MTDTWVRVEMPEWSEADIDRMAQAAADAFFGYNRWDTASEIDRDDWREAARAVLEEAGR